MKRKSLENKIKSLTKGLVRSNKNRDVNKVFSKESYDWWIKQDSPLEIDRRLLRVLQREITRDVKNIVLYERDRYVSSS